ncbi:hypothetical protein CLOSTHATH_05700 [Hungatella hathewayi DSM 13479]|uniref:Uncharacterized protein n=1 Tax=Hungatella hathewayi DSM 13479 TaxID=566550 RepID=D3APZ5_9FIRM|nr:hypothetical protein CLOSTHATH_05700 [Hungatella hathewayi DSM 13479]
MLRNSWEFQFLSDVVSSFGINFTEKILTQKKSSVKENFW